MAHLGRPGSFFFHWLISCYYYIALYPTKVCNSYKTRFVHHGNIHNWTQLLWISKPKYNHRSKKKCII